MARCAVVLCVREEADNVGMERLVITLKGENVIAALRDDPLSDIALTIECVGSDDPPAQRQHVQEFDDCRCFPGLGCRGNLGEHQTSVAAPCADHVQR